ncbi:hypothetical protein ACFSSC_04940 [Corynebacterium mendelii]
MRITVGTHTRTATRRRTTLLAAALTVAATVAGVSAPAAGPVSLPVAAAADSAQIPVIDSESVVGLDWTAPDDRKGFLGVKERDRQQGATVSFKMGKTTRSSGGYHQLWLDGDVELAVGGKSFGFTQLRVFINEKTGKGSVTAYRLSADGNRTNEIVPLLDLDTTGAQRGTARQGRDELVTLRGVGVSLAQKGATYLELDEGAAAGTMDMTFKPRGAVDKLGTQSATAVEPVIYRKAADTAGYYELTYPDTVIGWGTPLVIDPVITVGSTKKPTSFPPGTLFWLRDRNGGLTTDLTGDPDLGIKIDQDTGRITGNTNRGGVVNYHVVAIFPNQQQSTEEATITITAPVGELPPVFYPLSDGDGTVTDNDRGFAARVGETAVFKPTSKKPIPSLARFALQDPVPQGASIDDITGEVTFTPTSPGIHEITVSVRVGGNTETEKLVIPVDPAGAGGDANTDTGGTTTKPTNPNKHPVVVPNPHTVNEADGSGGGMSMIIGLVALLAALAGGSFMFMQGGLPGFALVVG